ncbi:MAG: helicase C-terminal domain-containing protein [Actinomycetota bacterium]
MGLDFQKLAAVSSADTVVDPRRIFSALPQKAAKYDYLRDVQGEVLEGWYERRSKRDNVLKMNTGSGKTAVGLLLLKSSLNEGCGPAVYVTPDVYLAQQVMQEALDLGLETTDDPRSSKYLEGQAILIVNIYRVVNGRSVFGVDGQSLNIPIGTLLIDDAHACLSTTEAQFTLKILSVHTAYKAILGLFKDDLSHQRATAVLELEEGDSAATYRVPFWSWSDRKDQVVAALHSHRDEEDFRFAWPLIKDCLHICWAVFSSEALEIVPPCPPIERIPSFVSAKRRIYTTATLANDSILVTDFAASRDSLRHPITPKAADDLGDRMILAPQEINPTLTDVELRKFLAELANKHNVVVIVPSHRRAAFWKEVAAEILTAGNLDEGIDRLKKNRVGLVVMVNKYDGVDLPGDACRILVIDGLPEGYRAIDRLEASALEESDAMLVRQIQRIEQGMGRAVRSNDDYCVVMLLGSLLMQRIYTGRHRFSPATRAQLDLSRRVAEQLKNKPLAELAEAIDQCLRREPGWVRASRNALIGAAYPAGGPISEIAIGEREAFDHAVIGQYRSATESMQRAIDASGTDKRLRGWLKQQAAAYLHFIDPERAQTMLLSALKDNRAVMKPVSGVTYTRLSKEAGTQAISCVKYLETTYSSGNHLLIGVNALLDDLAFHPETTRAFEAAMESLGRHLGFESHRPELETGQGPDVLWALGGLKYLVIECKSGATGEFIWKKDMEQLAGSANWFTEKYDASFTAVPLLVHRVAKLDHKAAAHPNSRVVTEGCLDRLKKTFRAFAQSVADRWGSLGVEFVADRLAAQSLTGSSLIQSFTSPPFKSS